MSSLWGREYLSPVCTLSQFVGSRSPGVLPANVPVVGISSTSEPSEENPEIADTLKDIQALRKKFLLFKKYVQEEREGLLKTISEYKRQLESIKVRYSERALEKSSEVIPEEVRERRKTLGLENVFQLTEDESLGLLNIFKGVETLKKETEILNKKAWNLKTEEFSVDVIVARKSETLKEIVSGL